MALSWRCLRSQGWNKGLPDKLGEFIAVWGNGSRRPFPRTHISTVLRHLCVFSRAHSNLRVSCYLWDKVPLERVEYFVKSPFGFPRASDCVFYHTPPQNRIVPSDLLPFVYFLTNHRKCLTLDRSQGGMLWR